MSRLLKNCPQQHSLPGVLPYDQIESVTLVDAKWTQSVQTPNPVALTVFPSRIWPLLVVFKAADRGMTQIQCHRKDISFGALAYFSLYMYVYIYWTPLPGFDLYKNGHAICTKATKEHKRTTNFPIKVHIRTLILCAILSMMTRE